MLGSSSQPSGARRHCRWADSVAGRVMGELAGDELANFEEHLPGCADCRRDVADFEEVVAQMRELAPEPLPRDLAPAILDRLAESGGEVPPPARRTGKTLTLPRIAAAAATLLFALTGGWMFLAKGVSPVVQVTPEVLRALDWLASSQEADGSWDAGRWGGQENFAVGLSGLAVLSFLGVRDAHPDGTHAADVERGLGYLAGQQAVNGRFGPFFGAALYNHGIATVALLEAYARTREAELRAPIGRALAFIRAQQDDRGGWGYLEGMGPANTSVTAWQLHALLLAASLDWPEARGAAERGLTWLEGVVGSDGLAGYTRPGDHPNGPETLTAMTAMLLAIGPTGEEGAGRDDARVALSLAHLASVPTGTADYYRSYFLTHALRVAGGAEDATRSRPAEELRGSLLERQLTSGPDSGSWSPSDQWGLAGGRVYSTAMAALSLEADRRADELAAWVRGVPQ